MNQVTLRQLRYFDAVARLGHFGRAAQHCAISQPALSMQVKELEKALRRQLLERRPGGVLLTEAGREIARRAAKLLSDVRDLEDYARHEGALLTGSLHFGVIPSIAPYVLPKLLPELFSRHPELDMHIRETITEQLLSELIAGELDLLLLALPVEHRDIETLQLFKDRFLLAMPKARQISGTGKISGKLKATPEMLTHDRLLLLEEGHCLRDQALSFCSLTQVGNIDTFGASSLSTIVQMVANGLGLTLLPEISLDLETRKCAISVMRFDDPEPSRMIGLAWRNSSPRRQDFEEMGRLIPMTLRKCGRTQPD